MEKESAQKRARVIAIGNQKGGVGKTTVTVHLATALAEMGRKCLIWDLDTNCGSTRHFGIPADMPVLGTFEVSSIRTRTEMTAGFTFATRSANPVGCWCWLSARALEVHAGN